jgi:hypothetical protein
MVNMLINGSSKYDKKNRGIDVERKEKENL